MRDQLNNNPAVQAAVVAVLLLGAVFFFMSSKGGGGEAESEEGSADAPAALEEPAATATGALPAEAAASAPPPPPAVVDAVEANQTVVLLFVREGAIDDELVVDSVNRLSGLPGVSTFIVPAGEIARYAAIAQSLAVDRVPALVVIQPKRLNGGAAVASVQYGFQSPQSVVQAVIDAGYRGPTLQYHP
ncbi:MAG TPA: hypothetical protein VGV34_05135 [Solirubrobacterales bacterium]|nr:hypothetical protein [Solirubrobacterales bacterium]